MDADDKIRFTRFCLLIIVLALIVPQEQGVAAETDPLGISSAEVETIRAVTSRSRKDSCLSIDATFSDPLKSQPTATVDVENLYRIEGVVSRILKAIQVSPKHFRFLLKADDDACASIRRSQENVVITVEGATAEDGRDILPEQRTFRAKQGRLVPAR